MREALFVRYLGVALLIAVGPASLLVAALAGGGQSL